MISASRRLRCPSLGSVLVGLAILGCALGCSKKRRADQQQSAPVPAASPDRAKADEASAGQAAVSAGPAQSAADKAAEPSCPPLAEVPWSVPAPSRVVAIGDVHGDLEATREVLQLAGAVDASGDWIGGDLVVVQTGDVLDRGDGERAILDWLVRLREQARAAGGALYTLNGNHELMNAAWDFRYVTPGGFRVFDTGEGDEAAAPATGATPTGGAAALLHKLPAAMRGRAAAFHPGGRYARMLAAGNVVQKVGDSVFVHGGVLPEFVSYGIERINREMRCWLADERMSPSDMPAPGRDPDGPVWSRHYSQDPPDCALLERALSALGASRMVVGHTPQTGGITSACDGKIWRIDTGIAAHYGGPRQIWQLRGDQVEVLGK